MFALDDSHWPLAVISMRGVLSAAEFDRYLASYEKILAREQKYVAIFDATHSKTMDVSQLKLQASWIKNNAERLRRLNLGIAFILPSAMIRGAFKAILWMQPIPQPYTVVSNFNEALRWAGERASAGGLHLPSSIANLRAIAG